MGRRKRYESRFSIGLDYHHAKQLRDMSNLLGLTYSEIVSYLMDYYQLGTRDPK